MCRKAIFLIVHTEKAASLRPPTQAPHPTPRQLTHPLKQVHQPEAGARNHDSDNYQSQH